MIYHNPKQTQTQTKTENDILATLKEQIMDLHDDDLQSEVSTIKRNPENDNNATIKELDTELFDRGLQSEVFTRLSFDENNLNMINLNNQLTNKTETDYDNIATIKGNDNGIFTDNGVTSKVLTRNSLNENTTNMQNLIKQTNKDKEQNDNNITTWTPSGDIVDYEIRMRKAFDYQRQLKKTDFEPIGRPIELISTANLNFTDLPKTFPPLKGIIRQGDEEGESEMTFHELARLGLKSKPKPKPKQSQIFSFAKYAKENYTKPSTSTMAPIPDNFVTRRKQFNNKAQFYKRKGYEVNPLTEEAKNLDIELKEHRYDDQNAEKTLLRYMRSYFTITIRNSKYRTLGNKVKVERSYNSMKGREEAKITVDVSVHAKESFGLFELYTNLCCSKTFTAYTMKECDCVFICCQGCKWVKYTTRPVWDIISGLTRLQSEMIPMTDIINIDLQTLVFDHGPLFTSACETNIDAYDMILGTYVFPNYKPYCLHTRQRLVGEYLVPNSDGIYGNEHIYNCVASFEPDFDKLQNFGAVILKKTERIGTIYYNDMLLGFNKNIDGEEHIFCVYTCPRHRGMELFRCSECRNSYNKLFSNQLDGYAIVGITRQGDESIEFSEQGGITSKMKETVINNVVDSACDRAVENFIINKDEIVTNYVDAACNKAFSKINEEKEKVDDFVNDVVDTACDQAINNLNNKKDDIGAAVGGCIDSACDKTWDRFKARIGKFASIPIPTKEIMYTIAQVVIKMLADDSSLTPYKMLEYTNLLGKDPEVRRFIQTIIGDLIPTSVFKLLFGRGTITFKKTGLTKSKPSTFVKLIDEGWRPTDDNVSCKLHELTYYDGDTYLKLYNSFKWENFTFSAQGDMPSFIETIISFCQFPDASSLLKKLQIVNQGTTAFKTIKGFVSFIIDCLPTVISNYFVTETELQWKEMCAEGGLVDRIKGELDYCSHCIINKRKITDTVFLPLEQDYYKLMQQVLKMGKEKSKSYLLAKSLFDEISKIKRGIEEKYMPGEARTLEPTWYEFVGGAGIGKSSMVQAMISAVDGIEIENVAGEIYTRGPTTYYDGYNGQKTIVYDDFNASTIEGLSDTQVVEVFLFVSNCEVPLNMASVSDKGTQMNAKRVLTLGNKFVDISSAISSKEALARRKTISASVVSNGDPDFASFSHLSFRVHKVDGKEMFQQDRRNCESKCVDQIEEHGVCFSHGFVKETLTFQQMCAVMKIKELRKELENDTRIRKRNKLEFHKLLKDVKLQGDYVVEEPDEEESTTEKKSRKVNISEASFYDKLKSLFSKGVDYTSKFVHSAVKVALRVMEILTLLSSFMMVFSMGTIFTILAADVIKSFLKGDITAEEFIYQSDGKTDKKGAKSIRLQGDKSFIEDCITRIEFKKGDYWVKSNCFVIGKTLLVNDHMLHYENDKLIIRVLWRDNWQELTLDIHDIRRLKASDKGCSSHEHDSDCFYCMNSYTDLTELNLGKFPLAPFKTRKNYFYSNKEAIPRYLNELTFICKRKTSKGFQTSVSHGKGEVKTMINRDGTEKVLFVKTNIVTENGDCGGAYVYKDRVLALHFGADTIHGNGIGQIVTREELGPFFEIHSDIKQQGENTFNLQNLFYEGELERGAHRSTKTELKKSLIYEAFGGAKTDTSVLSKYDPRADGIDPIIGGVQKYDSNVKIINVDSEEYIQLMMNTFKYDKKPSIISEHDAINGNMDYLLAPMDMSKSAGYGYPPSSQGKRNLFKMTEQGYEISDTVLRANVDALENSLQDNTVLLPISQITLKDERLKPGKATRTFNNFPVEYTIVARRYLGAFIGCAHSWYTEGKFYSIGINLYSNEAGMFIRDLLRVSNIAFDGDYKNYDGVLPTVLIYLAYAAIKRWCDFDTNCLDIIMYWFMHPTVVIEKEVYTQITGNSSGNLMTTLMNSMVGYSLLYLAYTNLVPPVMQDQSEFERNTSIKTFGDDNVCATSYDIVEYYNHQRVKEFFSTIGITYTRADKKDVDGDFDYQDEDKELLRYGDKQTLAKYGMKEITARGTNIEFLKNTFELRNYQWYALLREDVVKEMTYWIRSKNNNWTLNDSESLETNINTSLRFSYFYGRDYFEKWRKQLYDAVRENDTFYNYKIVTYNDIHRQVTAYGFIPELDNWSRTSTYETIRKI